MWRNKRFWQKIMYERGKMMLLSRAMAVQCTMYIIIIMGNHGLLKSARVTQSAPTK